MSPSFVFIYYYKASPQGANEETDKEEEELLITIKNTLFDGKITEK